MEASKDPIKKVGQPNPLFSMEPSENSPKHTDQIQQLFGMESSKDIPKHIDQTNPLFSMEPSKEIPKHIDQTHPLLSMEPSKEIPKHIDQTHPQLSIKTPKEEASSNYDTDNIIISCIGGFLRFIQLCLASIAVGLYSLDLSSSTHAKVDANPWWIYALTVASTSVFTVLFYSVPGVRTRIFWFWDLLLFKLWLVVFGRFATFILRYEAPVVNQISSEIPKWSDPVRMHIVVWVDLANMCLWLVTSACETLMFILHSESRAYNSHHMV